MPLRSGLVLLLSILIIPSLLQARCVWQLFSKDGMGSSYYLDAESFKATDDNKIQVMMKRTLPASHKEYKELLELIEIDCKEGSYKTLEERLRRKDDIIEEIKGRGIVKPITDNTPVDLLREAVCK